MMIGSSVLYFLLAIGLLVTVHEFGHYLMARLCGVKVLRFSLGFGPQLWGRKFGSDQTEWVLAAIPLGGYVKMLDEREEAVDSVERHRAFNTQSITRRCLIVAAGPAANFILAIFIYWFAAMLGSMDVPAQLGRIDEASAAAQSGLQEGDRILSVDGREVSSWTDFRWEVVRHAVGGERVLLGVRRGDAVLDSLEVQLGGVAIDERAADPLSQVGIHLQPTLSPRLGAPMQGGPGDRAGLKHGDLVQAVNGQPVRAWHQFVEFVAASPGKPLTLVLENDGQIRTVVVTPDAIGKAVPRGMIRVPQIDDAAFIRERLSLVRYDPASALLRGVRHTYDMAQFQLQAMWQMLTGRMSWRNVSGPVAIADAAGQSAQAGFDAFFGLIAALSVSLGVLNLLPIPILDGGHILYYVAECVRGRPLSAKAEEYSQRLGLTILVLLMSLAFFNDFNRVFFG